MTRKSAAQFFSEHPDIEKQIGKHYATDALKIRQVGNNNIIYSGKTVVASHIIVDPDYTAPKREKGPNGEFNRAELMQKGHMVAHQFGGGGGFSGAGNIFTQLYESNEYQRITAESYVRQLLSHGEQVEILTIPVYRKNDRVDRLIYLYRAQGVDQWSCCDIPNTIDELKKFRHQAYHERKLGHDAVASSFTHVNRYYQGESDEKQRT